MADITAQGDIVWNENTFELTARVLFAINPNGMGSPRAINEWMKDQTRRDVMRALYEGGTGEGYWNCGGATVITYVQSWDKKLAATATLDSYVVARHLEMVK